MLGPQYDRKECQAFEKKFPSAPAQGLEAGMIALIKAENPLELANTHMHSAGTCRLNGRGKKPGAPDLSLPVLV